MSIPALAKSIRHLKGLINFSLNGGMTQSAFPGTRKCAKNEESASFFVS